jgi:hydrogenase expression/formation protein HypC
MCLAVPLQISKIIDDFTALVKQDNTEIKIDTSLLENPAAGDYVIVHAGFAIEMLDLKEAGERIAMIKKMQESA